MYLRIFLLLILAALQTACSKSDKRTASPETLRLNLYCEPPSLDSRKATDSTSMNVLLMLFDGLTRVGPDHVPVPAVAKTVDVSEDQCTYTFTLKETFWSNGDVVTAEDFVYAWKKILDPKFPSLYAYKLYVIENADLIKEGKLPLDELGVKALNSKTLQIKLKFPTPYFLELLAFPTFYPVHRKNDEENPNWANEAGPEYVSNGPFCLKKWNHESEILVEKNPLYWDRDAVKLKNIHLSMIDDTTTEFYMYEMGELDWAGSPLSNLPPEFVPALKKERKIQIFPATAIYYYKLNTESFPLTNKKFRKALAYSINRHAIVEHITQGDQLPATALVPPMRGWDFSQLFKDADNLLARELFEEALVELNLGKEKLPPLVLCYNTNREHQKIAQAVQNQWQEVLGLNVDLENYDWKVYLSKINKQDYQIGRMGWLGDFHDPVSFLEPFKYKDNPHIGGNNETGWEHPEYISCLDEAQKEIDPQKRHLLLQKAEKILIDEMPIIPLYYITHCFLKKPYVKKVYLSPLGFADYKMAYIET